MRMPSTTPGVGCPECSSVGANAYDYQSKYLTILVKGSKPVTIDTVPVVQVSMTLAVSEGDFFNEDSFVSNMAFVLGIDPARIQRVNIVAGRQSSGDLEVDFEVSM